MDVISAKPSEAATEYLSGAYSMYTHIVAMPYQRSIQALLLLALALRTRHKEGVAWHVIGHAIRMAQSLGLHRNQGSQEDSIPDMELDRNICLITLHRTALVLDPHVFREQIKRHVPEIQVSYRLSRAEDICVASARTIVQVLNELKGSCGDFVHPITASSPLLATFVLTISILKHPGRWNVRSDLALLLNIASLMGGIFQSIGQDPAFNKMFALMRDAASKHTEHANPLPEASRIGGQSQANRTDGSDSARSVDLSELPTNDESSYSLQQSDAFELSSEEPWARLLSGNLDLDFEGGPWDFDLENFLGLPNFEEGALWL
ncbi:hypothetical protein SLS54_009829 [Diplodia seriata]